jgi:hypothetical protein
MPMHAQMYRPKKAKAQSVDDTHWLTFYDGAGGEITFFVDHPLVSTMLAEAFSEAQEKLRTASREQLIAEETA